MTQDTTNHKLKNTSKVGKMNTINKWLLNVPSEEIVYSTSSLTTMVIG